MPRAAKAAHLYVAALWAMVFWAGLPAHLAAHDIPADVTVQIFVRPEGQRLELLVRVPLEAMQDVTFPSVPPGYLDLARARAEGKLEEAASLWIVDNLRLYEDGDALPPPELLDARVAIPSDRSFVSYESARAAFDQPLLPESTHLVWKQALLDVHLEVPIRSQDSSFSIEPTPARLALRVQTVLRYLPPGGGVRAFAVRGDPGVIVLDPRWHQAALRFVGAGIEHILSGIDHLLFLACLVIPLGRWRQLATVVSAFTVAHSVTLISAAYGWVPDVLWFPPLIEVLIAVSIVYMAFENIVGAKVQGRWIVAFAFGLVHGFGFSFALRETLQFAGSHLLTSLVSFNVGVELGQVCVLLLVVPLLDLLFSYVVKERLGTILLSAIVAHTGWHWMSERFGVLVQYPQIANLMPGTEGAALRWWIAAALLVGGATLAVRVWRSRARDPGRADAVLDSQLEL